METSAGDALSHGHPLSMAGGWLARVRAGLAWIVAAFAASIAVRLLSDRNGGGLLLGPVLARASEAMLVLGAWLITIPLPDGVATPLPQRLAFTARISFATLLAAGVVLSARQSFVPLPPPIALLVGGVYTLAFPVGLAALGFYLAAVADRLPSRAFARQFRVAAVAVVLVELCRAAYGVTTMQILDFYAQHGAWPAESWPVMRLHKALRVPALGGSALMLAWGLGLLGAFILRLRIRTEDGATGPGRGRASA